MSAAPSGVLLYCRAGFEKECAAEIQRLASGQGISGFARAKPGSAFVLFEFHQPRPLAAIGRGLRLADLVFARQLVFCFGLVTGLPVGDRATPLTAAAAAAGLHCGELLLETADTNAAKELSALCRGLAPALRQTLRERGVLDEAAGRLQRLHVFFLDSHSAYLGASTPGNSSPWQMGIARLKMPRGAPSRATLKLAEAFMTLLGERERESALMPGMRAVDLGAAPGGWTWQLVQRHLRVTAVDNGALDPALLESGAVEHVQADGFRYAPKKPVDWLVCDMVEQPARIAALVADWLARGWARRAVFNLKLPMKKRLEEADRCRALIEERLRAGGVRFGLRLKQLYHDREEITGYLFRR